MAMSYGYKEVVEDCFCCLYSDLVPPSVLTNSSGLGTPAPDAIGEPIAALAASSNSSSDAEAWGAIVKF